MKETYRPHVWPDAGINAKDYMDIKKAIESGKNLVVVGATSTGKTTEFETIKAFPAAGRVFEMEEYAEFRLTDAEMDRLLVKPE